VMTGAELMVEIRERHPHTSRVILSGIRDQEEVARCLGTTHQFVPKPVNLETLRSTLTRICGLDRLLMDEQLRALVGQFNSLPSFPALYLEIMSELAGPDPALTRVAEIVAQDPAMTAKMLHIANSAAFGLSREISNPFEAVQFLGTATVRSLVLSVHVISCFDQNVKGFSIAQFEEHSLRCASLARAIAECERAEPAVADDAYFSGMLHDIGKLMLASRLPEKFQEALTLAVMKQVPFWVAEAEVFGASHTGVGAYLLGLWGIPAPIVEAVAFHHAPSRSDVRAFGPLTAVHVADVLEGEPAKARRSIPLSGLDTEYLAELNVHGRLDAWRALVRQLPNPEKLSKAR
jgi:HD-like signal output (HDOD) protein